MLMKPVKFHDPRQKTFPLYSRAYLVNRTFLQIYQFFQAPACLG